MATDDHQGIMVQVTERRRRPRNLPVLCFAFVFLLCRGKKRVGYHIPFVQHKGGDFVLPECVRKSETQRAPRLGSGCCRGSCLPCVLVVPCLGGPSKGFAVTLTPEVILTPESQQ